MEDKYIYNPELTHIQYLKSSLDNHRDKFLKTASKADLKEKLLETLGDFPITSPSQFRIESREETKTYQRIDFSFSSEADTRVPCTLLLPNTGNSSYPLFVVLQGHSSGMHISIGQEIHSIDSKLIGSPPNRDFAIQAVERGYAALCIENRCFGKRISIRKKEHVRELFPDKKGWTNSHPCKHTSMVSLLLGRTLMGERLFDISSSLDCLKNFDEVDLDRIYILGQSGGGSLSYYATCLDNRIKGAICSGSICDYHSSIMLIDHCCDNYLPSSLKYFEMSDLSSLICPRPLLVVTGESDPLYPLDSVKKTYSKIKDRYSKFNSSNNLSLVVGSGGHRFYPKESWNEWEKLIKK